MPYPWRRTAPFRERSADRKRGCNRNELMIPNVVKLAGDVSSGGAFSEARRRADPVRRALLRTGIGR